MCLTLKPKLNESLTFPVSKEITKPNVTKVYKVYSTPKTVARTAPKGLEVFPPFRFGSMTIRKGVKIVSNRAKTFGEANVNRLHQNELRYNEVHYGIHAIASVEKLHEYIKQYRAWLTRTADIIIVECELNTDDFVAVGVNNDIVANKLTPIRIVERLSVSPLKSKPITKTMLKHFNSTK